MDFLIDLLQWVLSLGVPEWVYYFVIGGILLACGFGLPIPEDITLVLAGLLVYLGLIDLKLAIAVCFVAVIAGDAFIFFLGSRYGRKLTRKMFFKRLLPEERLLKVSKLFNERGISLLFFARFMPGLRMPIYFSAGLLHVPFSRFIFLDGLAAMISVPLFIGLTDFFGDYIQWVIGVIRKAEHILFLGILCLLLFFGVRWWRNKKKSQA